MTNLLTDWFSTSELQKVVRKHVVFCNIFTCKCAFGATAACNFSTSELQKVFRIWCVLYMLTWKWSGEVRDEKWHAVSAKNWRSQTTFGNWDVENVNAVVARSTCPSQNVQNTPESEPEHVWKLRCRKSVHLCGAKHISKSKCTKHTRVGARLEVQMSKECTPLWREAPREPHKSLEKHGVSRLYATLLPFRAPASSVFWLFLLLFSSLTFPTSAFSSVHIVGSLTFKIPLSTDTHAFVYTYP